MRKSKRWRMNLVLMSLELCLNLYKKKTHFRSVSAVLQFWCQLRMCIQYCGRHIVWLECNKLSAADPFVCWQSQVNFLCLACNPPQFRNQEIGTKPTPMFWRRHFASASSFYPLAFLLQIHSLYLKMCHILRNGLFCFVF